MRPARLERATFCFVGKRSIRLSYGRICDTVDNSAELSKADYRKRPQRVSTAPLSINNQLALSTIEVARSESAVIDS